MTKTCALAASIAGAALLVLLPARSEALGLAFEAVVTGVVGVPGVSPGDPIEGRFDFDPLVPDGRASDPTVGEYGQIGASYEFRVGAFSQSGGSRFVIAFDDSGTPPDIDGYEYQGAVDGVFAVTGATRTYFVLSFLEFGSTDPVTSDAFPATAPDLEAFGQNLFVWIRDGSFSARTGEYVTGTITRVTVVPEPGSLVMLAVGVGLLGLFRDRAVRPRAC